MKLTGLIPNLLCADVARSLVFYRDVLGFKVTMNVPDAPPFVFVGLERDGVTVFLNDLAAVKKEAPAGYPIDVGRAGVSMFVTMEHIADLWAQLKDKAPVAMALKDQWYGMTEFAVIDPDGYVITFAERKGA